MNAPQSSASWNAASYQDKHSFVWRYGADLLGLLKPEPGERILDIGCGTGQLTSEIARSGAHVIGLDSSPDMLAEARKNFPDLEFVLGDASAFQFSEPFDAVFSNAALHWVKNAGGAAHSIATALRPGGRFVAEFGGHRNIASVEAALRAVLGPMADDRWPWYYPTIGEYATLLEAHGLEVSDAALFDRPTPLEGADGLAVWLRMFGQTYLSQFSSEQSAEVIHRLVDFLRPTLFHNGVWTVDYRRIRVTAVRLAHNVT